MVVDVVHRQRRARRWRVPPTRGLEAIRRWGTVVVAVGLVATVGLPIGAGAGPVPLVTAVLVVLGVMAVLVVEVPAAHRPDVGHDTVLWHPDDFAVHVDPSSGRVIRVEGGSFLVGRFGPPEGRSVDEVLLAPRFASVRDHRPRRAARRPAAFTASWRGADGATRRTETVVVRDGAHLVLYGRDITDTRHELDRLARRATTDPLTGLPNRAVLDHSLRSAAARSARTGERYAVVMLDLDGFKAFNDTEGHVAGDQLLTEVASALQDAARGGDDVVRLGGDELLVVARDLGSWQAAELVATRLLDAVRAGSNGRITASVGLALAQAREVEPSTLVGRADAAMYEAKRAGGDRCRLVDASGGHG